VEKKRILIELNQSKMIAYGVTPEVVSQILSQTNFITSMAI
jgi:multidrug efflux pump subunit AcrB